MHRLTDRAEAQTKRDEVEASQLRAGRHPSTGSHQKWLVEQAQFRTHRRRITRAATIEEVPVEVPAVEVVVKGDSCGG